jgi:hypothetical protein
VDHIEWIARTALETYGKAMWKSTPCLPSAPWFTRDSMHCAAFLRLGGWGTLHPKPYTLDPKTLEAFKRASRSFHESMYLLFPADPLVLKKREDLVQDLVSGGPASEDKARS